MFNKIIIFLLVLAWGNTFAKNLEKKDSLLQIIQTTKQDTIKVDALNRLFLIYEFSDTVIALEYLKKALILSEKINYKKGIALTKIRFGFYHEDQSRPSMALTCYKEALNIYEDLKNIHGMATCNNNMGLLHLNSGNYPSALKIFQKTLELYESLNDQKGIATTLNNIGNIHDYQGNLSLALDYYQKSGKISEALGDKKRIAASYNNIGSVFFRLKNYNSAIDYHQQSLKINTFLKSKKGMAYNFTNIGMIHTNCKNYTEAMKYYLLALNLYEELDNKKEKCVVLGNIAALYNIQKKYYLAIDFSVKNLDLAQETGLLENIMDSYRELANAYAGMKKFDQAYSYQILFKNINDSLVNTEKNSQLSRMEAIYQNEKKQKEIEIKEVLLSQQELEIKHQKTQKLTFAISALFLLILLLVILKNYKEKHKANILLAQQKNEIIQKSEVLNQQNEEIKSQRDMIMEQNEELSQKNEEIASQRDEIISHFKISENQRVLITHQKKELTDSINYAQRIQRAILPPDYYVKKCLPDSFILYLPKDVVSGDFYYIEKVNDIVVFSAVDCTGHGVPGSMMSVIGYNLINQAVKLNHFTKPSDILQFLDAGVTETLRQTGGESGVNDGMDLAVCSLDTKTNILQFAGAYNGIVYIKNKTLYEIKGENMPIGVNYDGVSDNYTNNEIQMEAGDTVYLYSDGYADQFGGSKGKKFKYKQLKDILLEISSLDISQQKEILLKKFSEWKGELEQVDDVMVIGVRVTI